MTSVSHYDLYPTVDVPGSAGCAWRGWDAIVGVLGRDHRPCVAIETYPGVLLDELRLALEPLTAGRRWVDSREALLDEEAIERLIAPFTGGDDPLFGYMTSLRLEQFFVPDKLHTLRSSADSGPSIVTGPGAFLIAGPRSLRVFADMPRWEAQQRQRRGEVAALGGSDRTLSAAAQYKRAFFVDWRVADHLKKATLPSWDFALDTTDMAAPKLIEGGAFRRALSHVATRPFRVVPFFDPGPWGGQWMKRACGLDPRAPNYAWCFDCVPEENSLRLTFGDVTIETPAINLVFAQAPALLGEPVFSRFGSEFPIRFDLLDTMEGGNLSLQVHPTTNFIREHFGMSYTQDESYYVLDAKPGAHVYLGRRDGVELEAMVEALRSAHESGGGFTETDYVAHFPARKHDHFLIPAGTLHCSGADTVVLEISATPYIFTFKLWDWERLGLDGKPRPINIERGRATLSWERDASFAAAELVNQVQEVARGAGWREERTGLHPTQFIETRRHWFTEPVPHSTGGRARGSVSVLNLVEGEAATVESPHGAFEPFEVHYAETFIVPAAVGDYVIRPDDAGGREYATIKAFVRANA